MIPRLFLAIVLMNDRYQCDERERNFVANTQYGSNNHHMTLGYLRVKPYLETVNGLVTGNVITDAKDRQYHQIYGYSEEGDLLVIHRKDGNGDEVLVPSLLLTP